jgi:RNA polymerase sigma-70 factor, ECF subfamily
VCLNAIAKRPKRMLPVDQRPSSEADVGPGRPVVEGIWLEPYPNEHRALEDGYEAPEARYERRESVELAFVAALQKRATSGARASSSPSSPRSSTCRRASGPY